VYVLLRNHPFSSKRFLAFNLSNSSKYPSTGLGYDSYGDTGSRRKRFEGLISRCTISLRPGGPYDLASLCASRIFLASNKSTYSAMSSRDYRGKRMEISLSLGPAVLVASTSLSTVAKCSALACILSSVKYIMPVCKMYIYSAIAFAISQMNGSGIFLGKAISHVACILSKMDYSLMLSYLVACVVSVQDIFQGPRRTVISISSSRIHSMSGFRCLSSFLFVPFVFIRTIFIRRLLIRLWVRHTINRPETVVQEWACRENSIEKPIYLSNFSDLLSVRSLNPLQYKRLVRAVSTFPKSRMRSSLHPKVYHYRNPHTVRPQSQQASYRVFPACNPVPSRICRYVRCPRGSGISNVGLLSLLLDLGTRLCLDYPPILAQNCQSSTQSRTQERRSVLPQRTSVHSAQTIR
jgi:hypothetical protein